MNQDILVFKENPSFTPVAQRMSDEAYKQAKSAIPCISVDAIIVNVEKKTFFLPTIIATPAQGIWVIGGGVKVGDSNREAMQRNFMRETKLEIALERFVPLPKEAINYVMWQTQPIQNLHFPFAVELTPEERKTVSANLDAKEYDSEKGLQEYSRTDLEKEKNSNGQILLHYYDLLFA